MHITRGRPPVITTYFLNGQALEVADYLITSVFYYLI